MKKPLLVAGIVVGSLLALGPFWGVLGTAFGMMHAFDVLGGSGVSDPRALSGAIGETLTAVTAGIIACPVGLALLATCIVLLVRSKKQQPPPMPAAPALE